MVKKSVILISVLLAALCAPAFGQGNAGAACRTAGAVIDGKKLYADCGLGGIIDEKVFLCAVKGYEKMLRDGLAIKPMLVIVDYSRPSVENRFFVVDIAGKKLLFSTLAAHGKNTGENTARYFSNERHSCKSCLGFCITMDTYNGENGYSLRLKGLEKGFNDNAWTRSIVIHGAGYVSREFIRKYGRTGRSWGCPALPKDVSREIIDAIKGGVCFFQYADSEAYLKGSVYLNK